MSALGINVFIDGGNVSVQYEETMRKRRECKGTSVKRYLSDYCLLDLETTGIFVASAKIVEISAVKVRQNQVVEEFSTLVNPCCHIPKEATMVHHITDDMVQNAPKWEEIADDFLAFVGDDVIVGYNNAAFDMNLIYDRVKADKGMPFSNDYIDVMHAARRSLVSVDNYKLETISMYYGLDTSGEHRALKDCFLTKACYERLYETFGNQAFESRGSKTKEKRQRLSAETVALQELHRFLGQVVEDGKVELNEVNDLRYWVEEHRELSGNYPFDRLFDALDAVLEDGKVEDAELDELRDVISEILNPVKHKGCHEKICTLVGKQVCLTGDFAYGTKGDVAELIEKAGGKIDKSVKKSTDYLVVGSLGSDQWKTKNYGGKVQKAMSYNEKGANIQIVEEQSFISDAKYCVDHVGEADRLRDATFAEIDDQEGETRDVNWKKNLQDMLDELVVEKELPEHSLYLAVNYGRDGKKVTSYSVCIYEPEYPPVHNRKKDPSRNSIVLNMKEKKEKLEILVGMIQFGDLGAPEGAQVKQLRSDNANMHVIFPIDSTELIEYVKKNTEYALANYRSKATSFGCCSKFNACSDAKKCIHENKLYSKACIYRDHLDAGRIFYGKNKNCE